MEIKKLTPEMIDMLRKPLPAAAISKHPTKTYLSSIKGVYVTERLNDVFGIGGWKAKSELVEKVGGMVVVKVYFSVPEYGIELESYGGNDNGGANSKNFDLGDAYKGAVTDAMTKIGSWLEIGIDVFKGQPNKPVEQKTSEIKQKLPELKQGSEQFDAVVKYITEGGDPNNVLKKYSVNRDLFEQLKSFKNELK